MEKDEGYHSKHGLDGWEDGRKRSSRLRIADMDISPLSPSAHHPNGSSLPGHIFLRFAAQSDLVVPSA